MHLSEPQERVTTVHLDVNYGLWTTRMCQTRFIYCNKCTALEGEVDTMRGYACVGQGECGKSLHLLLNFAVNLKLL